MLALFHNTFSLVSLERKDSADCLTVDKSFSSRWRKMSEPFAFRKSAEVEVMAFVAFEFERPAM